MAINAIPASGYSFAPPKAGPAPAGNKESAGLGSDTVQIGTGYAAAQAYARDYASRDPGYAAAQGYADSIFVMPDCPLPLALSQEPFDTYISGEEKALPGGNSSPVAQMTVLLEKLEKLEKYAKAIEENINDEISDKDTKAKEKSELQKKLEKIQEKISDLKAKARCLEDLCGSNQAKRSGTPSGAACR